MHERINGLQVRSRSLTQLDALGSKMLDTGEHHLGGGPSQQQSHHLHHHYQPQQLQHPQNVESNPRFLAPTAASAEGSRQNRRHKLSRSQVGIIFFRLNVCVCVFVMSSQGWRYLCKFNRITEIKEKEFWILSYILRFKYSCLSTFHLHFVNFYSNFSEKKCTQYIFLVCLRSFNVSFILHRFGRVWNISMMSELIK